MSASQRQEFCVRWNSHLGSIGASFPQLLAGQRFVDVTLACEGHQVHCHRLVLAACSSYFESILAENPCKHPVVILPSEIKLWEIQALVDFMYKGEVNVTQAGLPQLLRCAEQLRIKGLYGSDAALNLNQLKALTSKVAAAATGAAGLAGGGGGVAVLNDGAETDDTGTNSTTTTSMSTNTASSTLLQPQHGTGVHSVGGSSVPVEQIIKKEMNMQHHTNGMALGSHSQHSQHHQHQQHQQQQQQQQQQQHKQMQYQVKREMRSMNVPPPPPPPAFDDESADDSTSNAYDQYDDCATTGAVGNKSLVPHPLMHLDTTIEDDHNYVAAHDEDDSYSAADTEHETSGNSSALMNANAADVSGTFKRVRRSEASLAQAAKCVSKGQTFQTVSNMFNIPVSTIRFYMARKGILPKRKRGRGASTANSAAMSGGGAFANAAMTQALTHMKRDSTVSPKVDSAAYHATMGYKLNDKQGAAHMI